MVPSQPPCAVPLLMGHQTGDTIRALADALAGAGASRRVLLVASTDLSHYFDARTAELELPLLSRALPFLNDREPRDYVLMQYAHVTARLLIAHADLLPERTTRLLVARADLLP